MAGKTIKITSGATGRFTTIGINGRHRRLPHNQEIAVSDAELEVLENSRVKYEVVGIAKAGALKSAVDANTDSTALGSTDDSDPVAGADYLPKPAPVTPVAVRVTPEADDTPAGADHLTKTEGVTGEMTEAAREDAIEQQQAAADGTTEPAVVLTNADPDQTGNLNAEPFSAETTLDQSISKITEDMDEFTDDQLNALLRAEKSGKNRATLIAAIERKLA